MFPKGPVYQYKFLYLKDKPYVGMRIPSILFASGQIEEMLFNLMTWLFENVSSGASNFITHKTWCKLSRSEKFKDHKWVGVCIYLSN